MRKYSCSGPTVVTTRLTSVLPNSFRMRSACLLMASMERKQRRLFVQRLAAIGAEGRGDAEDAVLDKGVRGGIPCGVAPGLKGGPQAAGGEAGGVRFALDELFAGKFHDDVAVLVWRR